MKRFVAGLALVATFAAPAVLLAHEGHAHHVMGTVSAVSVSNIDVKDSAGKVVSFQLTAETKVLRGETPVNAADIKVGERVMVEGTEADGKMTAKLVRLGKAGM